MDLSSTIAGGLAMPASLCVPRPLAGRVSIAASGYTKQAMVGGVVNSHVQDASGRFWDRVGPPAGRTPR